MFQLEVSLENWKRKLASSNAFTESDIEELENHLLEEIDALKNTLTEEEAFYIACSRIGSVDLLDNEFSKVNFKTIWLRKFLWLISGYILINFFQKLISIFSIFVTGIAFRFTTLSSNEMSVLTLMINIIVSIIILCLLFLPKYTIISHLQLKFNFLFTNKRWLLVLVFMLFTIMNTIGFTFIQTILTRQIEMPQYFSIMYGNNIFVLVWYMILCLLFIFLSFKNYNMQNKSI